MGKKNIRAFGAPSRYLQGPGVLDMLPDCCKSYGESVFTLIDTFFYSEMSVKLGKAFGSHENMRLLCEEYSGEITREKIESYAKKLENENISVVVGIGGGKALDTAKDIANSLGGVPVIVVPTIASSDAPTSALSILYNDVGEQVEVSFHKANPTLVLVDTRIIAQAPPKFLAAGMGDALATYYEARSNLEANEFNFIAGWGAKPTIAGQKIAEACREILFRYGEMAMEAARVHVPTEAFEQVVEANILLSGVGYENMALAGAHSIHAGLSAVDSATHASHGEKVAFGLLAQLIIENRDPAEFDKVMGFLYKIGLPVCLNDLGIQNSTTTIAKIAENSLPQEWVHSTACVDAEIIAWGIQMADALGTKYKAQTQDKHG